MFEWFEYAFMVRALVATTVMSCAIAPVGAFLVLRRLSLAGEAMAHAIVPGIVIAFAVAGLSAASMIVGGLTAGIAVAALTSLLARMTIIREDASLASLYLIALALGIFILSAAGSAIPLKSFLFGSILGIDNETLVLIGATATITLVSFAFILRPLITNTVDPVFHESQSKHSGLATQWFMFLVVLNLLGAFKALGTLMAVGLMILPATAARYWSSTITSYLLTTFVFALLSCWVGLIVSFYLQDVPSGPAIILVAAVFFFISLIFAPQGFHATARLNPACRGDQVKGSDKSTLKKRKKTMRKFVSVLLAVGLALTALPATAQGQLKIVASFSILGDMVRQVTGDLASVTTIVGPDADAHVYTPNASNAKAAANADIIFVNGLGFETWSDTLIKTSGTKAKVFVATKGILPLKVEGETDPHAWNALTNGIIYVANIANALSTADPKRAATYKANAKAYSARLMALHNRAMAELKKLPKGERTVVTAHDAFGYLANTYGLNFLAPVGIDTDAEPSAKALAKLIDHLKKVGAGALFVENITSPVLVQQIARETGIKIGGRLFSDALSKRGGPAISYEKMFEHNLGTLLAALKKSS